MGRSAQLIRGRVRTEISHCAHLPNASDVTSIPSETAYRPARTPVARRHSSSCEVQPERREVSGGFTWRIHTRLKLPGRDRKSETDRARASNLMLWRETHFAPHVQLRLSAVSSAIHRKQEPFSPKHTLLSQFTSKNGAHREGGDV